MVSINNSPGKKLHSKKYPGKKIQEKSPGKAPYENFSTEKNPLVKSWMLKSQFFKIIYDASIAYDVLVQ